MKKFGIILLTIALLCCVFVIPASAAGSVSVSTGSLSIQKGSSGSFSVIATNAAGRVDISSSNPSVATVSTGSTWVENGAVGITVNAVGAGTAVITVNCTDVSDADFNLITGARTVTINVTEPTTKETTTQNPDANLRSMSVEGYTLSPAFNQWTTDYTIIVPKDTKSINLSATPLKGDSTVSGTGVLNISSLPQTFSIVCKASNGTTKTYHLTVKAPTEIGLTNLEVYALVNLDPAFDPATFEYTATVPYGTKAVYVKAPFDEETFKDAKIKIEGADDLKASGDTVTVTVTAPDGTDTVYTIHIKYADDIVDAVTETVERNRIPLWIVIIFLLLIIAFSIVCFFLGRRYESSQYEAFKKYYHTGDDDNDDDNDDSEGPSIFGGFDQSAD